MDTSDAPGAGLSASGRSFFWQYAAWRVDFGVTRPFSGLPLSSHGQAFLALDTVARTGRLRGILPQFADDRACPRWVAVSVSFKSWPFQRVTGRKPGPIPSPKVKAPGQNRVILLHQQCRLCPWPDNPTLAFILPIGRVCCFQSNCESERAEKNGNLGD